jgi:hypothetical protein
MFQIFILALIGQGFCSSKLYVYDLLRKPIMEKEINEIVQNFDYEIILSQPMHVILFNWFGKFTKAKLLSLVISKNSFKFGSDPYDTSLNELLFYLRHFSHFLIALRKRNDLIPLKICIKEMYSKIKGYYSGIEKIIDDLPSYSNHIMGAFQARIGIPASLIPLGDKFCSEWLQKKFGIHLPTLQQFLILKLIHKKLLRSDFLYTLKETYSLGYLDAIKDSCYNFINCKIAAKKVPKIVQDNMEYFSPIPMCWLKFWLLSMRMELDALELERLITNQGVFLHEKLINAVKYASRRLPDYQKMRILNVKNIEYDLEYSCLLIDYLISVANFAIHFDLISKDQALLFSRELSLHSMKASVYLR